jgi:hypothetical protein
VYLSVLHSIRGLSYLQTGSLASAMASLFKLSYITCCAQFMSLQPVSHVYTLRDVFVPGRWQRSAGPTAAILDLTTSLMT